MEFLQAYERSQMLDLTKEEFLAVWKSESELKMRMCEVEQPKHRTSYLKSRQETFRRQETVDEGSSVDPSEPQPTVDCQQTESALKQMLNLKFHHLSKQLMEKQEQFFQQMHLKFDQLLNEFQSHCELLSNHISNIADCQANSLKIYIMHEVDLLKQDLRRFTEDQKVIDGTDPNLSDVPRQQSGLMTSSYSSSQFQQSVVNFSQPDNLNGQINDENDSLQNLNKSAYECFNQNRQELQQYQDDLTYLAFDSHVGNQNDNVACDRQGVEEKLVSKKFQSLLVKSYANAVSSPAWTDERPLTSTGTSLPVWLSHKPTDSLNYFDPSITSVAATGPFAELIANQMKTKSSSQASSVTSSTKSKGTKIKTGEKTVIMKSLPDTDSESFCFTISNCEQFSTSHDVFLSPPVYLCGRVCSVRVGIKITEKSGLLSVDIRVSKGKHDSNHKWPPFLSSSGYICHSGSKCYTPLWQIKSVRCPEPQYLGQELIFPALVCLATNSCNITNVTYKVLVKRSYVGNNSLKFKWDLTATDGPGT